MNWIQLNEQNFMKKLRKQHSNRDLFSLALSCHIPLKEILESLDFADRIKKYVSVRNQCQFKKRKVLEIGCGHGFIGYTLLFKKLASLVYQIDIKETKSHKRLTRHGNEHCKMIFYEGNVYDELDYLLNLDFDIIIGCHLCGNLTDFAIDLSIKTNTDIAVCPCCYGKKKSRGNEKRIRELFGSESIDVYRCIKLLEEGYNVTNKFLNKTITPMNRIIIGRKKNNIFTGGK